MLLRTKSYVILLMAMKIFSVASLTYQTILQVLREILPILAWMCSVFAFERSAVAYLHGFF